MNLRKRITTALSISLVALGMLALAPRTASAQTVWVFDQMDITLKPCFRYIKSPDWVDFGNIGSRGQFAWTDFIQAAIFLGAPPTATEAILKFTWVASGPGATCPVLGAEPNDQTTFVVEAGTNVYIVVGGREEMRRVDGVRRPDADDDRRDR